MIKVGVSVAPELRMRNLRGSERNEPFRLLAVAIGGYALEEELHRQFEPHRYPGEFEWFYPVDELVSLAKKYGMSPASVTNYAKRAKVRRKK